MASVTSEAAAFAQWFTSEAASLRRATDCLSTVPSSSGHGAEKNSTAEGPAVGLEDLRRKVASLSAKVSDAAAMYLPSYDIARYFGEVKQLSTLIESKAPVKRFAFGKTAARRPPPSAAADAAALQILPQKPEGAQPETSSRSFPPGSVAVLKVVNASTGSDEDGTDKEHDSLVPERRPVVGDLEVTGLLAGSLAVVSDPGAVLRAFRLTGAEDSFVYFQGHVDGSVMMSSLRNCCIVIPFCHQLRIHDSRDCVVVVRVGSDPVLEGCDGLVFSFPESADPGVRDFRVCDFDWLESKPSPHWRLASSKEDDLLRCALGNIATPQSPIDEPRMRQAGCKSSALLKEICGSVASCAGRAAPL